MLTFYGYKKCSSCRDAEKRLIRQKIPYNYIDVTTTAPSAADLDRWLAAANIEAKKILNTSGELYRAMNLKDKVAQLSRAELIELMATHGRLIKRPLITDGQRIIPLQEFPA